MAAPDPPRHGGRGENQLLQAWRNGDRSAGELLYQRYYASVARFFDNKVADDVRDDLIQETFTACIQQAGRFQGRTRLRNYLLAIARRRLQEHWRSRARVNNYIADVDLDMLSVAELGPTPEYSAALRQEQRLLLEGLRSIPIAYQIVLELHYWEHLSVTDISSVLTIPLGTAKTRLRDGRKVLKKRLAEIATSCECLASTLDNLDLWAERTCTHLSAGKHGR